MNIVKISLIIPAYNEADRIAAAIEKARSYFDASSYEYEILVVDDGSSDNTAQAVRSAGLEPVMLKKTAERARLYAQGYVRQTAT